jgi:hypothetical protein
VRLFYIHFTILDSTAKETWHCVGREICWRLIVESQVGDNDQFKSRPEGSGQSIHPSSTHISHVYINTNLTTQLGDVEYICCTSQDFVALAEEAAAKAQVFALAARTALWQGNILYTWLVLCLVEDELIRNVYLHCLDALSCTQLDACNSIDQQEQDVLEKLAEKWNDPNLNPILPTNYVHKDFPTDCSHEKV